MFKDGNKTKVLENPLNDNYFKKEFQTLWGYINHQYAYTVDFDTEELIRKAIDHINDKLFVTRLQYTVTSGQQMKDMDEHSVERGDSFKGEKTRTETLNVADSSQIKYDLVGKIAEGAVLTRRTAARILAGLSRERFAMFRTNPEEFITKVVKLIKEQKATIQNLHLSNPTHVMLNHVFLTNAPSLLARRRKLRKCPLERPNHTTASGTEPENQRLVPIWRVASK